MSVTKLNARLADPADDDSTPALFAYERLRAAAAHGYDQGFTAGERAGKVGVTRAFDIGLGIGSMVGFALGIVFTVFVAPTVVGLLS